MQVKKRKRFSTLAAATQLWNEHAALPIPSAKVQAKTGFAAIDNISNDNKIRLCIER